MVSKTYGNDIEAKLSSGSLSINLRSKSSERAIMSYPIDIRNRSSKTYNAFLDLAYPGLSDVGQMVTQSEPAYQLLDHKYVVALRSGTNNPEMAETAERPLNAIQLLYSNVERLQDRTVTAFIEMGTQVRSISGRTSQLETSLREVSSRTSESMTAISQISSLFGDQTTQSLTRQQISSIVHKPIAFSCAGFAVLLGVLGAVFQEVLIFPLAAITMAASVLSIAILKQLK